MPLRRFDESITSISANSKKESIASYGKKYSLADLGFTLHGQLAKGLYSHVYSSSYSNARTSGNKTVANEKQLAVKVIDSVRAPHGVAKKFFRRELEILQKVHHPHIVHVQSIWKIDRKYLIFMRKAERGDLCNFIINNGTLKEPLIKKWSRDLTVALMYLHMLDIAHRDIKCENILITGKNNVKLCDFGFARHTHNHHGRPLFAYTDCGTFCYTAPEVIIGMPYNPKVADIWSFGVVIYIMLNGIFPFTAKDVPSLYREQIARNYTWTRTAKKSASKQLVNVIKNLLDPVYHERLSLEDLLHSPWLKVPKDECGLTQAERTAIIRNPPTRISNQRGKC